MIATGVNASYANRITIQQGKVTALVAVKI